ncbi:MAG TPA: hypothetical protein EYP19_08905 [Desulfobacterales bacterium]|nr:hypothetical protein [Desulfobacterales bacterium]
MTKDGVVETQPVSAIMDVPAPRVLTCAYFSRQHIQSACHLLELAKAIEERNRAGEPKEGLRIKYSAYVSGVIFASVAFLEATINEFFWQCAEGPEERVKDLDARTRKIMAGIWKQVLGKRFPLLEKYQIALSIAGQHQFDEGKRPYQDVRLLVDLRNELVHFKPEWVSDTPHRIEKKFASKRFRNPLAMPGSVFPDTILSWDCGRWSVASSLKLTDDFFGRIGLEPPYKDLRLGLKTK